MNNETQQQLANRASEESHTEQMTEQMNRDLVADAHALMQAFMKAQAEEEARRMAGISSHSDDFGGGTFGGGAMPPARNALSDIYQERYEAGDEGAIFEYVRRDIFAFREMWVVSEIERYGLLGTTEGRTWLERLMGAYMGKTTRARGVKNRLNGSDGDGVVQE